MSRTVCSWCKAPLVLKDDILVCSNTDCPACDEKYLHEELIRTRKALDKAKNGLKELKDIIACPPDVSYETCVSMYADGVLQEITTLEQKN